jgi:hypothetical protein
VICLITKQIVLQFTVYKTIDIIPTISKDVSVVAINGTITKKFELLASVMKQSLRMINAQAVGLFGLNVYNNKA